MQAILSGVRLSGVADRAGPAQMDTGLTARVQGASPMRRQGAEEAERRDQQRHFRRGAQMRQPRASGWLSQTTPEHCSPHANENLLEDVLTPTTTRFRYGTDASGIRKT
jgi:hypothetical protein